MTVGCSKPQMCTSTRDKELYDWVAGLEAALTDTERERDALRGNLTQLRAEFYRHSLHDMAEMTRADLGIEVARFGTHLLHLTRAALTASPTMTPATNRANTHTTTKGESQ